MKPPGKHSPLFLKSYEMLVWLLRHTAKFPRQQRFVMARRMEEAGLGLYDALLESTTAGSDRPASVIRADIDLIKLKHYNRLCKDLEFHTLKQYEFLAGVLEEIGRLLGGYIKACGSDRTG